MRLIVSLILSVFISLNAWAAACASNAAGPWSTAGTWTSCGGGSPGIGDTASITHAVTVSANTTVGTSPAGGNTVITLSSSGSLTVNSGVSLTVRGGIEVSSNTLTLESGSILEFDASNATTPLSQKYELRLGTGHNQTPQLIANGTSGSHVTIRSNSGGGNAWINDGTGPWLRGAGHLDLEYVDFLRIGDSSNRAIRMSPTNSGDYIYIRNCTFDTTGGLGGTYNANTDLANYQIEDNNFTNTAATEAWRLENATSYTSGTRTILRNVFDKHVLLYTPGGFTIQDNYFHEALASTDGQWTTFRHNFVRLTNSYNEVLLRGSTYRNFWYWDEPTQTNPHFAQAPLYTLTVDGDIFESDGTGAGDGDCILGDVPGVARTLTVQNCIVLPNANGANSGTLVSLLGNANVTLAMNHNTGLVGTQGLLAVGETYTGHAGMVTSYKSNIAYDTSARGYHILDSGVNDSVSDLITPANANYNNGYNVVAGSNLKGYNNLEFSSGSPGANDLAVNPNFVDSSRDFAKWDQSLGGAGTDSNAITELRKRGLSTWDSNYSIQNLITYVRAGFAPTNASLQNAGHDGVTIGAVEYQAAASGQAGGITMLGVGY
jgi:hypothetical protein